VFPVRIAASVLSFALLAACPDFVTDEVEDRFTLGANSVVDVLFVMDDSNTMGPTQEEMAVAASEFLLPLDLRSDWQIGVVTTDMEDPARRGRLVGPVLSSAAGDEAADLSAALRVGIEGSQFEAGLSAMWSALSPPLVTHENDGLRREGARLVVIVVSDEDDCSDEGGFGQDGPESCVSRPHVLVPVSEYLGRLHGLVDLQADVTVIAAVDPGQTEGPADCGGTSPGTRYIELARATGGGVDRVCGEGSDLMSSLGAQAAGAQTGFPLSRTPDPASIDVRVGDPVAEGDTPVTTCGVEGAPGEVVPEDPTRVQGWSYDPDSNAVRIHGTHAPAFGRQVRICYEVG